MYSYKTTVSFSKIDKNGKMPLYEVLRYLQDCSTFQSQSLGIGPEYLLAHKRAWILLAYKIQLLKDIKYNEQIEIGTSALKFDKVMATRQFFIKDSSGEFAVKAESIWSLLDLESRMPTRINQEDAVKYGCEEMFESIKPTRKMKFSGEKEVLGSVVVPNTYIDINGHMNNTNYARIAQEFLPDDFKYNQVEIVYSKEALEKETIVCALHKESDGVGITLENHAGEPFTLIRYKNI